MAKKNKGVVTERELFHGTSLTHPLEICLSEEGFDVRHSQSGSWGHANYFAGSAKYSNNFAHTSIPGYKQMILAIVTLGYIFGYKSTEMPDLRLPPLLETPGTLNFQNQKYDSTSGIRNNTHVYMTYMTT